MLAEIIITQWHRATTDEFLYRSIRTLLCYADVRFARKKLVSAYAIIDDQQLRLVAQMFSTRDGASFGWKTVNGLDRLVALFGCWRVFSAVFGYGKRKQTEIRSLESPINKTEKKTFETHSSWTVHVARKRRNGRERKWYGALRGQNRFETPRDKVFVTLREAKLQLDGPARVVGANWFGDFRKRLVGVSAVPKRNLFYCARLRVCFLWLVAAKTSAYAPHPLPASSLFGADQAGKVSIRRREWLS